jgi:hypothetical protein
VHYTQFVAKHNLPADKSRLLYVASQGDGQRCCGATSMPTSPGAWLGEGVETVAGSKIPLAAARSRATTTVFAYITEDMAKNRDLGVRFIPRAPGHQRFLKDNREQATQIIAKGSRLDRS